jgi:putative transposase
LTDFFRFLMLFVIMTQDTLVGAECMACGCVMVSRYSRYSLHLWHRVIGWVWKKPAGISSSLSLSTGTMIDLSRSKHELMVENAVLRQQLIVLRRQVQRPKLAGSDRFLLVLLASRLRTWRNAQFIVKPDTLVRWHRQGFRLFWKRKSKACAREPSLSAKTIELIKQMAQENRLWGAERIRGEMLKLDFKVSKRTVQN